MMELPAPTGPLFFSGGLLRPWELSDAPALLAAWQDDAIARFNAVPSDPSLDLATRWISGTEERQAKGLAIDFVIEQDHPSRRAGEVGLSGFNSDGTGALVGYWLIAAARGSGVATAAVSALTDWAFEVLELEVLVARCDPANRASQRVAERCNFTHESHDPHGKQLWRKRTK